MFVLTSEVENIYRQISDIFFEFNKKKKQCCQAENKEIKTQ